MNEGINPRRIYIANIPWYPPNEVTPDQLKELCSRYGNITDIFFQKKFSFIEYQTEEMAKSAIIGLNGQNYFGSRLLVEACKLRSTILREREIRDKLDRERLERERDRSPLRSTHRFNRGSNHSFNVPVDINKSVESYREPEVHTREFRDDRSIRSGHTRGFENNGTDREDREYGNHSRNEFQNYGSKGGFNTRYPNTADPRIHSRSTFESKRGGLTGNRGNTQHREDNFNPSFRPNSHSNTAHNDRFPIDPREPGELPSEEMPLLKTKDYYDESPNDIEIVVSDQSVLDYGEFIEGRFKSLGYTVDILFPNDNVSMRRVIDNITNRGTLHAVIITNENKFNRSLTLHFLQDDAQELRDMLLEEAIKFLEDHHGSYKRKVMSIKEKLKIPDNIRELMEIEMSELKTLTDAQYDELLLYFTQKKAKMCTPLPVPPPIKAVQNVAPLPIQPLKVLEDTSLPTQQAQLTTRILDILNKPQSSHVSSTSPSLITRNLQNSPNVIPTGQIVLNNLIKKSENILRNFNPVTDIQK